MKRGGDAVPVTLQETMALSTRSCAGHYWRCTTRCAVGQSRQRKARIIELRYFGGLTYEEIASVSGVAAATVKRDLRLGEAWLRRDLGGRA